MRARNAFSSVCGAVRAVFAASAPVRTLNAPFARLTGTTRVYGARAISALERTATTRVISSTRGFASDAGKGGRTLSEALLEERAHESAAYEPSATASGGPPEPFALCETDGDAEVTLTRSFGENEEITVTFIAQEEPYDDDMLDEDEFEEEPLDDELDLDEEEEGIAINFNVVVSKKDGLSHLDFDCVTDGEIIEIRHVGYEAFDEDNPIIGTAYSGPNFEDLEETVQDKFHDYLEERGINADLASYIVEAHVDKEQREYTNWLEKVSRFVASS